MSDETATAPEKDDILTKEESSEEKPLLSARLRRNRARADKRRQDRQEGQLEGDNQPQEDNSYLSRQGLLI